MSYRDELAEKLGAKQWDGELLAMWSLERIKALEVETARMRAALELISQKTGEAAEVAEAALIATARS